MKENIKIGMIQMKVLSDIFSTEIRQENVKYACLQISNLLEANENVDIVVLPEEFYAGAGYGPISLQDDYELIKETVFSEFSQIAKRYHVNIAGALSTKFDSNSFRGNNIGFVINRNGELVGIQERFHQTANEKPYSYSGKEYNVFELDLGKIALMIGVDSFYPEVARNFVLKGAEIIINPILAPGNTENTGEIFPNNLYKYCAITRALENQVFTVMVNGVGEFAHVEMDLFGESLVAGPIGLVEKLGFEEDYKVISIHVSDLAASNKNMAIMNLRNSDICKVVN